LGTGQCQESHVVVLVLVCHEAVLFSARSRAVLKDELGIRIREHLLKQAKADPPPRYILMATHWLSKTAGPVFLDAARFLAAETGATAITTCFAPSHELDAVAQRFCVQGTNAERVATLSVEDTPGEQTPKGQ
jgi:hypothetical protein